MRKLLTTLAACLVVAGCVSNQAANDTQALNQAYADIKAQVAAGTLLKSKAYEQLFQKTLEYPQASGVNRLRQFVHEMAIVARQLEAGEITQTQYEDIMRGKQSATLLALESDNREAQQYREAQRAQQTQSLQQTLQILNASQPKPAFAPSVNCQARTVNGVTYTNCR